MDFQPEGLDRKTYALETTVSKFKIDLTSLLGEESPGDWRFKANKNYKNRLDPTDDEIPVVCLTSFPFHKKKRIRFLTSTTTTS